MEHESRRPRTALWTHPAFYVFVLALVLAVTTACASLAAPAPASNPAALRETIFVALIVPPDAAALHVDAMLRAAATPARVFVGLADFSGLARADDFAANVRVRRNMHAKMRFRESSARAALVATAYRDEQYVLLLPHDAELAPGWDETLVRMHDALGSPCHILTSTCGTGAGAVRDATPTFLCLDRMRGARISVTARPVVEAPTTAVPSLFWSPSFSFCTGDTFQAVPLLDSVSCSMEVTLNSIRLWTHGYDFIVPSATVAWAPPRAAPQTAYASNPPLGAARTLAEYEAFCGVQFRKRQASARAHAGLSLRADVRECTCKYGSLEKARLAAQPVPRR